MTEGCLQIVAVLVSGYTVAEDWLFYSPRTHVDSGGYEPVLVCFSVAVVKYSDQKQLGKKRLFSCYAFRLQSIIVGGQARSSRQDCLLVHAASPLVGSHPQLWKYSRNQRMLLANDSALSSLTGACSAPFLRQPQPSAQDWCCPQ